MQIRMLGPFAVEHDGVPLKLAGPKQRAVLSLLALHANSAVSIERLIEGLWGEDSPSTAPKMIQQYVSQLRRLGPDIHTHGRGYELHIDPARVDALHFEQLIELAGRGGNGARGQLAREALALWRGEPLVDLIDEPFAAAEARRLEDLRLGAIELSLESDLEQGFDAELIARLRALVDEHPLRERLRGLLMLALYRAGRQAEALDAFQDARWTLTEELGLDPGPELRRLQEAILRQDPALDRVVPDTAWASRQTVEQVGAGAGRISQRRGELRADERALAANVIDLQTLRDRAGRPGAATGMCPFKGLESFDVADAEYYFGRERLVAEIVARLPGTGLLGVIGPSGSGKSSAVRAGLVPALDAGVLPGSERWTRVVLRPGDHPMAALQRALTRAEDAADPVAAALGSLAPGARLLIVVDQFEETFTACRDVAERDAFLEAMVGPAARGDGRFLAVLAVRADFYGACAGHPQLAQLLGENHVLVGRMRDDELARAIEGPALKAGLSIDAELVARLVEETAGRPGGLPLLSTTLLELWQRRSGDQLTIAAYERTGGVQGAVARLAETAFERLSPAEETTARNIFLRLAGASEEREPAVRRQVPLAELDLARSHAARRVLDVLTENRLLTVGDENVEVAHEALLREWPRLRGWLEEDVEARRVHRHITEAARDWEAGGRDPSELYRGARLAAALDFAADHAGTLNALERDFLDHARLVSEREAVRGRRLNRRLRTLLAAALAGLAVAGVAGVAALDQRGDARDQARVADAQRLGAQAVTDDRVDRAMLLARAGVALDDSPVTRGNLLATLLRAPAALLGEFPAISDEQIQTVAVSPKGDLVAFGDAAGRVRLIALPSRRPVGTYRIGTRRTDLQDDGTPGAVVQQVAFSPDGATLAVTGQNPIEGPPLIDLLDVPSLERRARVTLPRLQAATAYVNASVVFAPNGRDLLTLLTAVPSGQSSTLWRVDGQAGKGVQRRSVAPDASYKLLASGDAQRVLVSSERENTTYEFAAEDLRLLARHPVGSTMGALSTDGTLALGGASGEVQLLELRTGRRRTLAAEHTTEVSGLSFTPDGRTLISASDDGEVLVHDLGTGGVRERLETHAGRVEALATTPDGRALVTAGLDARALLWDLTGTRQVQRTIELQEPFPTPNDLTPRGSDTPTPRGSDQPSLRGVDVSADGRTLVVTNPEGTVDLLRTDTLERRTRLQPGGAHVLAADFSADGRHLATAGEGVVVSLWDAASGRRLADLRGLVGTTLALAFSPDGKLLAGAAAGDPLPRVRVWDVAKRAHTAFKVDFGATSIAFHPNGRTLAAATIPAGAVEIRDARTGRRIKRLEPETTPRSVAFTPDGRLLFVGLYDGSGRFYSTTGWRQFGGVIRTQTQRITSSSFTPDGRVLATGSADGSVQLWDVAARKPIGPAQVVERDAFITTAISPDGTHLYAMARGRRGIRLALPVDVWSRHACTIGGRELTRQEWADALPRQPYRRVCSR